MKLLFLDQFSQLGGAQQCLLDLLPAIEDAVVAMPGDGPMFERIRALGFETAHIDCGPYASGQKSAVDMARFTWEAHAAGTRQIRRLARSADLVYINGPRLLPVTAALQWNSRACWYFTRTAIFHPGRCGNSPVSLLKRLRARVIASCRYVAEPWKPYARAVSVIYNGVASPKRPRPPRNGPPAFGCIGRIAPEKGQREFVEVARIIHGKMPAARFVMANRGNHVRLAGLRARRASGGHRIAS